MAHNAPFRLLLKVGFGIVCLGAAGRLIYRTSDAYRTWLWAGIALLAVAAALGAWLALRDAGAPLLLRLFLPGRSRTAQVLHVLSFFTFADPGEVSWHAVEQSRGRGNARSLVPSALLYATLVLPGAMLVDWLTRREVPLLTVAAFLYFPPWLAVRALEEAARRRHAR